MIAITICSVPMPFRASGQELIKNMLSYDEQSIIRCINADEWLVYSHGKNNVFYKATPSGTTSDYLTMSVHNMKILDFEIFEGTVYFCGITDTLSPKAIVGHFKLEDFPSCDVKWDIRDEWTSFRKLDVFRAKDEVHVVMTATYNNGYGTMVDAREFSSGYWNYSEVDFHSLDTPFYDVAVTENWIVFTSGAQFGEEAKKICHIWYIEKPTMSGISIFNNVSGNMLLGKLHVGYRGDILIEHTFGDNFYIACRANSLDIAVTHFTNTNNDETAFISFDTAYTVMDLKKNFDAYNVTVLMSDLTGTATYKSEIANVLVGPSSIYLVQPMIMSTDELIYSIDWISGFNYAASSHEPNINTLHVDNLNTWLTGGTCFESGKNKYGTDNINFTLEQVQYPQKNYNYPEQSTENGMGTIFPQIICQ